MLGEPQAALHAEGFERRHAHRLEELDRHDQFEALARLIRRQRRQRLGALQQVEPFLVERRHAGGALERAPPARGRHG